MRALSFLRHGHILIFHGAVVSLFAVFAPLWERRASSASPLRSAKHPLPWIFRSISFSCTHIHHRHGFPIHWRLFGFGDAFRSPDNTDWVRPPLSLPPAVPGAAVVGRRSRSFSRLSPVSDGLSAQTKWRLVVSTSLIRGEGWRYSNIRRERGEGGRKGRRGEVVFVGVRDCPETGSVLGRQWPISVCLFIILFFNH